MGCGVGDPPNANKVFKKKVFPKNLQKGKKFCLQIQMKLQIEMDKIYPSKNKKFA